MRTIACCLSLILGPENTRSPGQWECGFRGSGSSPGEAGHIRFRRPVEGRDLTVGIPPLFFSGADSMAIYGRYVGAKPTENRSSTEHHEHIDLILKVLKLVKI